MFLSNGRINAYLFLSFLGVLTFCEQSVFARVASWTYTEYKENEIAYPKVVITDVNDTLIKSWWPTYEIINNCLSQLGFPTKSKKEIDALPLVHVVDLLWHITGADLSMIENMYKEECNKLISSLPPVSAEGAEELLEYLRKKNIPIIVVSNDEKRILFKNLEKLHWIDAEIWSNSLFKTVVTKNEMPNGINKPDPRILSYAMEKAGLNKSDYDLHSIWFLGDSYNDMKCASDSDIVPIWVGKYSTARAEKVYINGEITMAAVENLHEVLALLRRKEPKKVSHAEGL